jgi:hypothetical protein
MFNNNGAQSTVQPTGTSTSTVTTSDGYKWKFMYNVDSAKLQKFLTENHIPVQTLTADDGSAQWDVQQAAANGSIEIYDVTAGGSGYLQVKGNISAVVNSSVITLPAAASGTSSVYVGSTVFISSGLGAGQLRQITNYSGTTKRLTVNTAFTVVPNTSSTFHVGPYINISGDGSGASAYANVSSGAVSRITAINNGSNYSRASVNITANPSYGSGAAAIAYLSPHGGHGSDAEFELGGSNVMLNAQFDGTENGFIVANNDFRVYGIVTDPLYANGSPVLVDRANQTTRLTLTSVSGTYTEDEFVSGGTSAAKGRVVQFANTNAAGTTGILSLTNVDGSFTATETVTANTSGVTATLSSITLPDVEPFTGKVIYIVNRTALDRDVNQTEDIKFTVKF